MIPRNAFTGISTNTPPVGVTNLAGDGRPAEAMEGVGVGVGVNAIHQKHDNNRQDSEYHFLVNLKIPRAIYKFRCSVSLYFLQEICS